MKSFFLLPTSLNPIHFTVDGMWLHFVMWLFLNFLCISPDLQHIRNWAPHFGQPCTHLDSCLWPKVSRQHATPQRDHTQAPEREWRVNKSWWCTLCSTRIIMLLNCQSLYTAPCILCIVLRSRTPTFRKAVTIPTPRTPTPFKNALAAQEKMHGPLKMEVRAELHLCVTVAPPFTWFRAATDGTARLVLATAAGVSGRRHTRSSEAGNWGWHL